MNSNADFISKFLAGDTKTIQNLYQRPYQSIERYILNNGGSKEEAKDIFQNGLVVLYVKLKKEEIQIQSFYNYLFSVCKNLWIKESSKKKVTKFEFSTLVSESIDLAEFHREQQQFNLFKEYLSRLGDSCKQIISMTLDNMSYAKIIEVLGYENENAARQKVFRCKNRLFKMIKADKRYKALVKL